MQILQNIHGDLFPTSNELMLLCIFIADICTSLIFISISLPGCSVLCFIMILICVTKTQITTKTRILCKCAFKYFDFSIAFF